jgi:hypothetical protein
MQVHELSIMDCEYSLSEAGSGSIVSRSFLNLNNETRPKAWQNILCTHSDQFSKFSDCFEQYQVTQI